MRGRGVVDIGWGEGSAYDKYAALRDGSGTIVGRTETDGAGRDDTPGHGRRVGGGKIVGTTYDGYVVPAGTLWGANPPEEEGNGDAAKQWATWWFEKWRLSGDIGRDGA